MTRGLHRRVAVLERAQAPPAWPDHETLLAEALAALGRSGELSCWAAAWDAGGGWASLLGMDPALAEAFAAAFAARTGVHIHPEDWLL